MDQISIKAPNPNCRLFLKLTSKGTWRQVVIYVDALYTTRSPPPPYTVQRQKITKNAYNVAKILTNLVILQNYFQKLSFLKNKFVKNFSKINSMLHIIFAVAAV
jgi:hypothetical protein